MTAPLMKVFAATAAMLLVATACGDETASTADDDASSNSSGTTSGSASSSGSSTGGNGGTGSTTGTGGSSTTNASSSSTSASGTGGGGSCTPETFNNHSSNCIDDNAVVPETVEFGQYGGVTLAPPSYPFEVSEVSYTLRGGPGPANINCDGGAIHEAIVFATDGAAPNSIPSAASQLSVHTIPAATPTKNQIVVITLSPPVTLTQGQRIAIMVEMLGNGNDRMCWESCNDGGGQANSSWWSGGTNEPFNWMDINGALNVNTDMTASATGCSL